VDGRYVSSDVNVYVSDKAIITVLNTPGGDVFRFRNNIGEDIAQEARRLSPVNNPLNAMHRGGKVGEFKRSWFWTPQGSNQHQVRAVIYNESDHAVYVEEGRRSSRASQTFSWTHFTATGAISGRVSQKNLKARSPRVKGSGPPKGGGAIRTVQFTGARRGKHVLKNATNRVLVSYGLYPGA